MRDKFDEINAKIFFEKGLKLFLEENYENAEVEFKKSLELYPNRLSIINNLIKVYIKTHQNIKLQVLLDKHHHLKNEETLLLGSAYNEYFKENYNEATKICKKITNNKNLEDEASDLLIQINQKKKNFLKVLNIYKKKLKQNKNNYLIYYNIGCFFLNLGKINQAYYYLKKSIKLNPLHHSTLWNISICALSLKDFKTGFKLYDYRFKKNSVEIENFKKLKTPENILEIQNKSILIWSEQGLGDTIQFSRFVIDLLNFTKKITLLVNNKLKKILTNLDTNINVIDYESLDFSKYELQIPIGSLPKLLNIQKLKDINFYKLNLNNREVGKNFDNNKFNVGIAWSGNPNYAKDEYRSVSFQTIKKIFFLKNVNFYKLSQNKKNIEETKYSFYPNLYDFSDKSFYEIACLMHNLDLVVSTDTSIIHLAGIMNIKSFLLLNFNSDWRWFDDIQTTHWYPSIKIFKQNKIDSWEDVIDKVIYEIKKLNLNRKTITKQ